MKIVIFWVAIPYRFVGGYQHFGETFLHIQGRRRGVLRNFVNHPQNYLSIYGSKAPCWILVSFSVSSYFTQLVGLLGQGISPSQDRCLHKRQQKHKINAHRHPCLEWDSNSRSQRSRAKTVNALDRAATVIFIHKLYGIITQKSITLTAVF
jgi:hypothetical protein